MLFDLQYKSWPAKTVAAKKLARETGVSVREVERQLDAYLFLDEIPRWESGGLHCPYLLQRMFAQTENVGQKEHNWVRQRGCAQSSTEQGVDLETPCRGSGLQDHLWRKFSGLYQEVYQVRRTPGPVPGSPEVAEQTHQEILDLLRECLHCHRQGSAQPEEPRQTTMMPAVAEYHAQIQAINEHFGCFWDQSTRVQGGGP